MQSEILERARHALNQKNLHGALLANPFTVAWVSAHFPSAIGGPDPFEGGPALLWLGQDTVVLLVSGADKTMTRKDGFIEWTYMGYTVAEPAHPTANLAEALRELLYEYVPAKGLLGVEMHYLPAGLLSIVEQIRPRADWLPVDDLLCSLRAVKTEREIAKVRASLSLCDLAQQTLRASVHPGISEIELFAVIQEQLVRHASCQLPIITNLIAGTRTAGRGLSPSDYRVQQGDFVLFDIVLRNAGYWGDNCSTSSVGGAPDPLKRMYNVVRDALHKAEEMIRPGLPASDLDRAVRDYVRARGYEPHWHHTGHGIGVSYHEAPRIVPYNHEPLEAGMVICMEPGIYLDGIAGVRLEDVLLVTPGGNEILSQWSVPFEG